MKRREFTLTKRWTAGDRMSSTIRDCKKFTHRKVRQWVRAMIHHETWDERYNTLFLYGAWYLD